MKGKRRMGNPFTEHCRAVGETHPRHLAFAVGCGTKMVLGGLACVLHGLLPFAFPRTGSRTVFALSERMGGGGRRAATPATPAPPDTNR